MNSVIQYLLAGVLALQSAGVLYQSETVIYGDSQPEDALQEELPDDSFGGFDGDDSYTLSDDQESDGLDGTSVVTIDTPAEINGESFLSSGDDENALRITGTEAVLNEITVNKIGGESSDLEAGNYYGLNAALLAKDGAQVTITNSTIQSNAVNGNALFSYGPETEVNISSSEIVTSGDYSAGIQVTDGAATSAADLSITTYGNSSAAIRTGRNGAGISVNGGSYETNGVDSPVVYSTADISISEADLQAMNSEALVIDGNSSLSLSNSTILGNMASGKGTGSGINVHNVMLYQSMNGDAPTGIAKLGLSGCELVSQNGDQFFVTNTQAELYLSENSFTNSDGNLFTITGNDGSTGWGEAGSNGATAAIYVTEQQLDGDIVVDTISSMMLSLASVEYTGAINIIDNPYGAEDLSHAVVILDEASTWNLSGDCTISELYNNGTIFYNGYTITLADGTVLSEPQQEETLTPPVSAGEQNTAGESRVGLYGILAAGALALLGGCLFLFRKKEQR